MRPKCLSSYITTLKYSDDTILVIHENSQVSLEENLLISLTGSSCLARITPQ